MTNTSKPDNYIIDSPSQSELAGDSVDMENPPLVSVCIPTYNDEETIGRCLQSFVDQKYPNLEIVIVDGYSEDDTIPIASQYTDHVYYEEGSLGKARQRSVEESEGEIIALFDGDIYLPHQEWLLEALGLFNYDSEVSTVWPRNVAPPGGSLMTQMYFNHWEEIIEDRIVKNRGYFGGGNSLFRRDCLEEIGGINPDIHWGEDFDWASRLADHGYKVVYHRDPVYHDTMQSLTRFTKKQFTGAETFAETGFGLMGMSFTDVLFEQYILGFKGMIKGIVDDQDLAWSLFPIYITLRSIAYGYTFARARWLSQQ